MIIFTNYKGRERTMAGTENDPVPETAGRELVITRVFDAPRALVWNAWTDPEHLMR